LALADDDDTERACIDPSFAKIRDDPAFLSVVGTPPPTDLLALEPFTLYAKRLKQLGLSDASRLIERSSGDRRAQLAGAVRASELLVQRWHDLACLCLAIRQSFSEQDDDEADRDALARTERLLRAGVDSQAAIPEDQHKRDTLTKKLADLARTSTVFPRPSATDLLKWRTTTS
jgi:hypothetical protein